MKTFTVYLMNDEVNTVGFVARTLEDVCALTTQGASIVAPVDAEFRGVNTDLVQQGTGRSLILNT